QTQDGGYLILASKRLEESTFSGIHIMKADHSGVFESGIDIEPSEGVNATGQLMALNGNYYFFCMNELSLDAQLASVNEDLDSVQMRTVSGKPYPAAAATDGTGFILLNYDHEEKQSVLSWIDNAGSVVETIMSTDIGV